MDTLQSEEINQVVREKLEEYLSNGYLHLAKDLQEQFPLNEQDITEAAMAGFINTVKAGLLDEAESIRSEYNLSQEFVDSEKVRSAASNAAATLDAKNYKSEADRIRKTFNF